MSSPHDIERVRGPPGDSVGNSAAVYWPCPSLDGKDDDGKGDDDGGDNDVLDFEEKSLIWQMQGARLIVMLTSPMVWLTVRKIAPKEPFLGKIVPEVGGWEAISRLASLESHLSPL